jgi:hypothetical protein
MHSVPQSAVAMQALCGHALDELARTTGCVERERKFSGSSLLGTLVLTLLKHPAAKDGDYQTVAAQLGIDVTEQAIRGRFTPGLVAFLQAALQHVLAQAVQAALPEVALLKKFTDIRIGDSTTLTLPAEFAAEFPGCGGSGATSEAAMKIQVMCSLSTGQVDVVIQPGRASDVKSPIAEATPPAGSLSMLDLGYFSVKRFRRIGEAEAYWISRLQHGTKLFDETGAPLDLLEFLRRNAARGVVEMHVLLGQDERLACRLIRVPQEVAARRRQRIRENARDHGYEPSEAHLEMQDWTILITNCGEDLLTWKEVVVLYRARWQIELLFKLWKSHNGIDKHAPRATPQRQMAVVYAKLIGVIVQHWLLLTAVWQDPRRSLRRAAAALRDWIPLLIEVWGDLQRTRALLERLQRALARTARMTTRRKHPSSFQLLDNPELLEYIVA